MIKLNIDNRDFEHVHIDTYSMLTGESADEMMREFERDNAAEEGREYDENRDINYDMDAIRKGLALESINYLENELKHDWIHVIKEIKLIKTGSPRFYNYTTDWYVAEYAVDEVELDKYIEANTDAIQAILETYTNRYDVNLVDNKYHAAVCHIIDNEIDCDDYNMAMWEIETEVYYENMQFTDEK